MFERLSEGFNSALRTLTGKGEISETNVKDAMQQVRTALLDADVNKEIVDQFCADVTASAMGQQVLKSLEPGQQMIGIVHQKLIELMDPDAAVPTKAPSGPGGAGGAGGAAGLAGAGAMLAGSAGSISGGPTPPALHNLSYRTLFLASARLPDSTLRYTESHAWNTRFRFSRSSTREPASALQTS